MEQRFLQQILPDSLVAGQSADHPRQGVPGRKFIHEHIPFVLAKLAESLPGSMPLLIAQDVPFANGVKTRVRARMDEKVSLRRLLRACPVNTRADMKLSSHHPTLTL